jgi:trehalose utilization protein
MRQLEAHATPFVDKPGEPMIRLTVWAEPLDEMSADPAIRALQELERARIRAHYPAGVHHVISDGLSRELGTDTHVSTATLVDREQGLAPEVLDTTDVLVWWSHARNDELSDEASDRVVRRVREYGMGLIVLHSGLESKPFRQLMGTSCQTERWRHGDDYEAVWTVEPSHEIAAGIPPVFVIPHEEMWCEFIDIPVPEDLVFISSFAGGEICRSGCCFHRGKGRIFYFRPGHEAHATFHQQEVQRILANAVRWAHTPTPSRARFAERWEGKEGPVGWFSAPAPG